MTSSEHGGEEREYTLTEAARILNKTESALRMRIKRGTLNAKMRFIDGAGDRYQYMIPESELERERHRSSSTLGSAPLEGWGSYDAPSTAATVRDTPLSGNTLADLAERLARLEKSLEKEREDTRALIRGLEKQVELLTTMVSHLIQK